MVLINTSNVLLPKFVHYLITVFVLGDATHVTAGREDGEGVLSAMRGAFDHIGLDKFSNLWCINAHATSTPLGDKAEITAVSKLLQNCPDVKPYITSNKGNFGHLLGAAGSVESVLSILSLKNGIVPKTLNLQNLTDCDNNQMIFVSDENVQSDISDGKRRLLLKNSLGFGGTNVSLIFSNYVP